MRVNVHAGHNPDGKIACGAVMLIECCFVDDKDDVKLYDAKRMAAAIVIGIIG